MKLIKLKRKLLSYFSVSLCSVLILAASCSINNEQKNNGASHSSSNTSIKTTGTPGSSGQTPFTDKPLISGTNGFETTIGGNTSSPENTGLISASIQNTSGTQSKTPKPTVKPTVKPTATLKPKSSDPPVFMPDDPSAKIQTIPDNIITAPPATTAAATPTPTPAPTTPPAISYGNHVPLNPGNYFSYGYLSVIEKKLYNDIGAAIYNYNNLLNISSYNYMVSNVSTTIKVFFYFLDDHPDVFWVSPGIYCYTNIMNKLTYLGFEYFDGSKTDSCPQLISTSMARGINASRQLIDSQRSAFTNKVSSILKNIPAGDSPFSKEKKVYDWLTRNCVYDYDAANSYIQNEASGSSYTFTSYAALVSGKAVCSGYAKALQYLLNSVGIECTQRYGTVEGIGHEWTMVKIDGDYYQCDPTWDSNLYEMGSYPYYYFNRIDSVMAAGRTFVDDTTSDGTIISVPLSSMPKCNSTKWYYLGMSALTVPAISLDPDYDTSFINNSKNYSVDGQPELVFLFNLQVSLWSAGNYCNNLKLNGIPLNDYLAGFGYKIDMSECTFSSLFAQGNFYITFLRIPLHPV